MNRLQNTAAAPEASHFEEIARRADGSPARADAGLGAPAMARLPSMNSLALDIGRKQRPDEPKKHKKSKSKKNKPGK